MTCAPPLVWRALPPSAQLFGSSQLLPAGTLTANTLARPAGFLARGPPPGPPPAALSFCLTPPLSHQATRVGPCTGGPHCQAIHGGKTPGPRRCQPLSSAHGARGRCSLSHPPSNFVAFAARTREVKAACCQRRSPSGTLQRCLPAQSGAVGRRARLPASRNAIQYIQSPAAFAVATRRMRWRSRACSSSPSVLQPSQWQQVGLVKLRTVCPEAQD